MPKGKQVANYDLLFSLSDTDFLGEQLCDDLEFRFDFYAPVAAGGGTLVGGQSEGKGEYDLIAIFPGLHVEVYISEDGENFEYVDTWNATGPTMIDITEEGSSAQHYRGHQLIADPADGGTPGTKFLKYAVGNFFYEGDADNNAIQDLDGNGQILDLASEFC